jgi:hypothetical protein
MRWCPVNTLFLRTTTYSYPRVLNLVRKERKKQPNSYDLATNTPNKGGRSILKPLYSYRTYEVFCLDGPGWIRTSVGVANGFTVRPH